MPHVFSFFGVAGAHAATLNAQLPSISGIDPTKSPAALVTYAVVLSMSVVVLAAAVAFIIGGLRYLTAQGNPSAEADAKDRMAAAGLGTLLVLAAIAILYTLNPDLVRLRSVGLPLVSLPLVASRPPLPQAVCTLSAASWESSRSCYNTVSRDYEQGLMVVQGSGCSGSGVLVAVSDASGSTIGSPASATFNASNNLRFPWQPPKAGTYTFTARAGSGSGETTKTSGTLTVTDSVCAEEAAPYCYNSPAQPCLGNLFQCDRGVADQLTRGEASDALTTYLTALGDNLRTLLPGTRTRISAISDSSGAYCFDQARWTSGQVTGGCDTCAANGTPMTRGAQRCCGHSSGNSCHYGGTSCHGRSYAVDFGDENHCQAIVNASIAANPRAWFNWEGDHLHFSLGSQYNCGCDVGMGGCVRSGSGYVYRNDQCPTGPQKTCDAAGNIVNR